MLFRSIACVNNLKQLGLGFAMYSDSNRDNYPWWNWTTHNPLPAAQQPAQWFAAIAPYVGSGDVFICSSRSDGDLRTWGGYYGQKIPNSNAKPCYGYNEQISGTPTTETQTTRTSEILLAGDARHVLGGGILDGYLVRYVTVTGGSDTVIADLGNYCAHSSGSNVVYADKHVSWSAWRQLRPTGQGGSIRYYRTEW